jgi:hypothetical protein
LSLAAVGNTAWSNSNDIYSSIKSYAQEYGNMNVFTLLSHYLYGSTDASNDMALTCASDLNNAPFQGPMFHPQTSFPIDSLNQIPGWEGNNKYYQPLSQNGTSYGEFNGLDYMLMYNLFWLDKGTGGTIPGYVPYTYGNILDTNNPITTSGTVYRDGPIHFASAISPPSSGSSTVVMQSSYEINLLPGFQTTNGADITLQTKPLGTNDGASFVPVDNEDLCLSFTPTFYGASTETNAGCPNATPTITLTNNQAGTYAVILNCNPSPSIMQYNWSVTCPDGTTRTFTTQTTNGHSSINVPIAVGATTVVNVNYIIDGHACDLVTLGVNIVDNKP